MMAIQPIVIWCTINATSRVEQIWYTVHILGIQNFVVTETAVTLVNKHMLARADGCLRR